MEFTKYDKITIKNALECYKLLLLDYLKNNISSNDKNLNNLYKEYTHL